MLSAVIQLCDLAEQWNMWNLAKPVQAYAIKLLLALCILKKMHYGP